MSFSVDVDLMELLEELRKKLDLVEAFWWFAENGVEGFCCPKTTGAMETFERKHAPEVFELIEIIHRRVEDGKRDKGSQGQAENLQEDG